jgi:hypothetical protein
MKIAMRTPIFACFIAAALILAGCGGGGGGSANPPNSPSVDTTTPPTPAVLIAADAGSPYVGVLVDCVLVETDSEFCTLATLPLLGQEKANPSIDDVLARTVISHPWMGVRFRQVLQAMPDDILSLMKGVTAIVIASDIRPSYYFWGTGAIYVDPAHLWFTNGEKATISKDPDFRADFGVDLSFVTLYRYVTGTRYAWDYFDLEGNETRTLSDIEGEFAAMLFHELAHANDAFPPPELAHLDRSMSLVDAFDALAGRGISEQLAAHQPLNSQLWMDLAEVLYLGTAPTPTQRGLTAAQVGLELESDGANDDYAYVDSWEDLAMLVEEVMMHYHYGIDREIAYTNMPTGEDARYCDFYIVDWGVRNRISDPLVRSRAEFGLQLLLDKADVSQYLKSLPSQWRMVNGRDWCTIQNRGMSTENPAAKNALAVTAAATPKTQIRRGDLSIAYR